MFKNLTIGTKLLLGFLTLSVLALSVGGIGLYYAKILDRTVNRITEESEQVIVLEKFRTDFLEQFEAFHAYTNNGNFEQMGIFYTKKREAEEDLRNIENRWQEEKQNLEVFREYLETIDEKTIRIFTAIEQNNSYEQQEALEALNQNLIEADRVLNNIILAEKADLKKTQVEANQETEQAEKMMMLTIILSFVISLLLSLRISGAIKYALAHLEKAAQEIGKGNYQHQIKIETNDELGTLAMSFNQMIRVIRVAEENLRHKIQEIKQAKEKTEAQSEKIREMLHEVKKEKDISESLAEDLKKFQLAVKGASDHITIADSDMKILFANQAAEKITGYDHEAIIGQNLLWTKEISVTERQKIRETLLREKKSFSGDYTGVQKNGEKYQTEVHIAPLLDKNNTVRFLVEIDRDITKAKRIQQMKSEFVTLASHQLRTPLSSIKWYLEMMLDGTFGDINQDQKETLSQLLESNDRMVMIVNNLLNITSLEKGSIPLDSKNLNLKHYAEVVMKELEPIAKDKLQKINLESTLDEPIVYADQSIVTQLLQNLVSNAIGYSSNKKNITIRISQKSKHIRCEVIDEGYGIPKAEQDHVFKQFFRGSNTANMESGSGLGLYIVKLMVEISQGKMGFTSKEGEGSIFWFSLPKGK